jgi:hypothetical protein
MDIAYGSFNHIYVIEMKKNQTNWFFFNISPTANTKNHKVCWTPNIKHAHVFTTEQAVEEFKSDFIAPRRVSIIRIK